MMNQKSMTLNSRGWYARYYKHFYQKKELPMNLCPLFWSVVFALLSTPIVLPTLPWKMKVEGRFPMGLIGWMLITLAIGYLKKLIASPWNTLIATAVVIGITAVIIGAIALGVWIKEKLDDVSYNRRKKAERIRMGLEEAPELGFIGMGVHAAKAWYHRYCPMVTWR